MLTTDGDAFVVSEIGIRAVFGQDSASAGPLT
jgi:hypothetical protein